MEKIVKAYKIIPVEFKSANDGAYILSDKDGEQYEVIGNNFPTKKGGLIQMDDETFLKLTNDIVVDDHVELVTLSDENNESNVERFIDLSQNSRMNAIWTRSGVQILIDMMKQLSPHVFHPHGIKTMKQMWEIIAKELDRNGFHYEIQQVESKWKTLRRTYRMGLNVKNKRFLQKRPFNEDIREIISNLNKCGERSSHVTPCGVKRIKLGNNDREEKIQRFNITQAEEPDEKVSKAREEKIQRFNITQAEEPDEKVSKAREEKIQRFNITQAEEPDEKVSKAREEKIQRFNITQAEVPDEKVSDASSSRNAGGINTKLAKIIEAIETGNLKRDKTEQRKMEQRERLINAIEKGNELLYQLLNKK